MPIVPNEYLTVSLSLFAVIDIIGSVPAIISLQRRTGRIQALRATVVFGIIMIVFSFWRRCLFKSNKA